MRGLAPTAVGEGKFLFSALLTLFAICSADRYRKPLAFFISGTLSFVLARFRFAHRPTARYRSPQDFFLFSALLHYSPLDVALLIVLRNAIESHWLSPILRYASLERRHCLRHRYRKPLAFFMQSAPQNAIEVHRTSFCSPLCFTLFAICSAERYRSPLDFFIPVNKYAQSKGQTVRRILKECDILTAACESHFCTVAVLRVLFFSTSVLPQYCHGTAMVLPWYCHGTAMVLPRYCHGTPVESPRQTSRTVIC